MLLDTMEEVVKRNGDLKFAAVSPHIAVILELTRWTGCSRYSIALADAVESFHAFDPSIQPDPEQRSTYGIA